MHPALQGIVTIFLGVGGCLAYFYFSNQFIDKVLFPAKGVNAGRNINGARTFCAVAVPCVSGFRDAVVFTDGPR